MKLSKRLSHIDQMVVFSNDDYTHIWDCCCDHGLLGVSLLKRKASENIHFVDIVPKLMAQLETKLKYFHPKQNHPNQNHPNQSHPKQNHSNSIATWKTHCLDVTDLPLQDYPGRHLIIIAGVGGDLMTRFIDGIHQKYPNVELDFLLCPVHRQYAVRKKLIELNFSLIKESLIEDKQRFYEVLFVSSKSDENAPVSPVGNQIWQSDSVKQTDVIGKYLNNTLAYYQRMQKGNSNKVDDIIKAYQAVVC